VNGKIYASRDGVFSRIVNLKKSPSLEGVGWPQSRNEWIWERGGVDDKGHRRF